MLLHNRMDDKIGMLQLYEHLLKENQSCYDQSLHRPILMLNDTVNNHEKNLEPHDLDQKYYCNRCYGKNNNRSVYLYIRPNGMIDRLL